MRILVSALSCNASLGSEDLIGYKTVEALSKERRVPLLDLSPSEIPAGAKWIPCTAQHRCKG